MRRNSPANHLLLQPRRWHGKPANARVQTTGVRSESRGYLVCSSVHEHGPDNLSHALVAVANKSPGRQRKSEVAWDLSDFGFASKGTKQGRNWKQQPTS